MKSPRLLVAVSATGVGLGLVAGVGVARGTVPSPGASSRPATAAAVTSHGFPRLLAPTVTHEPDSYELLGVSCASQHSCVAVGYAASTAAKGLKGGVLVPIINGRPGKPVLSSDSTSVFYAVSCLTAKKCVVVGQSVSSKSPTVPEAAAWLWNGGKKLSFITEQGDPGNETSVFRSVDCESTSDCLMVGDATHPYHHVSGQPFAEFGVVSLKGRPTLTAIDNNATLGYAASMTCPSSTECMIGGATAAGAGVEAMLTLPNLHNIKTSSLSGAVQPSVSGLQGIACIASTSCEAAEVQDLPMFGQYQGWMEHLNGSLAGTPKAVVTPAVATQMFSVATINRSAYLAVGYAGLNWLTDLVTASGRLGADSATNPEGYLENVTCPFQTMCVAVGFAADSRGKQPGGLNGVDGAIAVFHLKTQPSAPSVKVLSVTRSSAKVQIKAPSSDGAVTVTSYHLVVTRCAKHHKGCKPHSVETISVTPKKLTVDVGGLHPKSTYSFSATATNAIGAGPSSRAVLKKTK